MRPIHLLAAAAFCCIAQWAHAASLGDADTALVCAVVDLASCTPGDGCQRETADTMNAPQLITIDWKGQEIDGQRANRGAPHDEDRPR